MSRWVVLPLALLSVIVALVFFLANRDLVEVDLYVVELAMPIGVLVPVVLLVGFVIAALVLTIGVILPQRLRLRAQARMLESGQVEKKRESA